MNVFVIRMTLSKESIPWHYQAEYTEMCEM